jgi:hypothetical protein
MVFTSPSSQLVPEEDAAVRNTGAGGVPLAEQEGRVVVDAERAGQVASVGHPEAIEDDLRAIEAYTLAVDVPEVDSGGGIPIVAIATRMVRSSDHAEAIHTQLAAVGHALTVRAPGAEGQHQVQLVDARAARHVGSERLAQTVEHQRGAVVTCTGTGGVPGVEHGRGVAIVARGSGQRRTAGEPQAVHHVRPADQGHLQGEGVALAKVVIHRGGHRSPIGAEGLDVEHALWHADRVDG